MSRRSQSIRSSDCPAGPASSARLGRHPDRPVPRLIDRVRRRIDRLTDRETRSASSPGRHGRRRANGSGAVASVWRSVARSIDGLKRTDVVASTLTPPSNEWHLVSSQPHQRHMQTVPHQRSARFLFISLFNVFLFVNVLRSPIPSSESWRPLQSTAVFC